MKPFEKFCQIWKKTIVVGIASWDLGSFLSLFGAEQPAILDVQRWARPFLSFVVGPRAVAARFGNDRGFEPLRLTWCDDFGT